jgi:S1-C subfamily serine protease
VDGKPALSKDGYAKLTQVHDDRGNLTQQVYFGVDGKPALHKDGYARYTAAYDGHGNQVEVAYFGADGKPTLHKDGYAGFKARYDERGNQTKKTFLGVDGKPVRTHVVIAAVAAGSQGQRAGLLAGDVLLAYDGKPVVSVDRFVRAVGQRASAGKPGPVSLRVRRKGKERDFALAPGLLGVTLEDRVVPR